MCGIIGYLGPQEAMPIILDGLKRLEYRGYDSAGMAVISDQGLAIRRSLGKLLELEKVLRQYQSAQHEFDLAGGYAWRHRLEATLLGVGLPLLQEERPLGAGVDRHLLPRPPAEGGGQHGPALRFAGDGGDAQQVALRLRQEISQAHSVVDV